MFLEQVSKPSWQLKNVANCSPASAGNDVLKPVLGGKFGTAIRISLFLLLLCGAFVTAQLPPQPAPHAFLHDHAKVTKADDRLAMKKLQDMSYAVRDTPIVVVTIRSKADWGRQGERISNVAQQLFDHWEIGKRKKGRLINRGILVLVSMQDRQARIELGADWGASWNKYCDQIMQEKIIAGCKSGDVSGGLRDAVEQLAEMSKRGPDGNVPFSLSASLSKPMVKGFNDLPRWIGFLVMTIGVVTMGAAFAFPNLNFTKSTGSSLSIPIFSIGAAIFLFGVLYKAILILLLLPLWAFRLGRPGSSNWSSGGFGDGGGGFGSGGSSGGGGASGEW